MLSLQVVKLGDSQKQSHLNIMQNLLNFKNFAPIARFILFGLLIAALTAIGPAEKTLGANARGVYLHGVWVWTALACFAAAAISGAVGLAAKSTSTHYWSRALGRTGLFFWITYLPISV